MGATDSKPKVFLSYGRRDAGDYADRVLSALGQRGYDVWRDTSDLRGGRSWEEQIIRAIRDCDVVVALLSPHSTRVGASADGEDSVCLDELALARYEHPRRPIVPVHVVPGAAVPLTVMRLHQLDFTTAWADRGRFESSMNSLVEAVDGATANAVTHRNWEEWLRPPSDAGLFLHSKRRRFSGRRWLLAEIDQWRVEGSGYAMLLMGDPGVGKSAVIAELSLGPTSGDTLATYCCQWDVELSLRPSQFVRSIASQLALRLPEYESLLIDESLRQFFEGVETDPGSALEYGILAPLAGLQEPVTPRLLCVDALDEALLNRTRPTIVDLLASRLDRLPSWLRLLVTSRRDRSVIRSMGLADAAEIRADSSDNLEDLRHHVSEQLASIGADGIEDIGKQIVVQANGNFLYADHALREVTRTVEHHGHTTSLPAGLAGFYDRDFHRLLARQDSVEPLRIVLELLCAAEAPLPTTVLVECSRLDEAELFRRLLPIEPLLRRDESSEDDATCWTFWHKSVLDYLTDVENADTDFYTDRYRGDAAIGDLFIRRLDLAAPDLTRYLQRHGLTHLAASGQFLDGISAESLSRYLRGRFQEYGARPAVGTIETVWPSFIALAVESRRWHDLDRIVSALVGEADQCFDAAGLFEVDALGPRSTTGSVTDTTALSMAYIYLMQAIAVVDQALGLGAKKKSVESMAAHLKRGGSIARGIDLGVWGNSFSGYFMDQGDVLSDAINNLLANTRAKAHAF